MAWPEDAVEVGRILDAWGIKGGLRVQPFSADPQALFSSRRWYLRAPELPGAGAAGAGALRARLDGPTWPRLLKITQAREHGDGVVATAQDVNDRSAAEALRGARIFVARSSFPTAASDEYYWVDLIGLTVLNREAQVLGEVIDLLDTGPHSVLRLRRPDAVAGARPEEAERLIPFVAAFVDQVDLPGRRILVDWGLDY